MNKVLLSLMLTAIALAVVGCGSARTPKNELVKLDSLVETGIVKTIDSIDSTITTPPITAVFAGGDGKTRRVYQVTVVFYPDQRATLTDDDNTYQLDQYVTADGYGYKDKKIDLRGRGNQATLTYSDGLVLQLTEKELSK